MDVQIAEKDGYTATREIRAYEEVLDDKVPIIALNSGNY